MTNYWRGKKVVVTGGRGFVGSFLVDLLLDQGAEVLVMDNGVRGKNHNPYASYITPRMADVSSQGHCGGRFKDADVGFNLAAPVGGL